MNDYSLLDFGEGQRLERFGNIIVDRPSPAAEPFLKKAPQIWRDSTAKFIFDNTSKGIEGNERGKWVFNEKNTDLKTKAETCFLELSEPDLRFCLKFTPFGHVGVFPEQIPNWKRIYELVKKQPNRSEFCVLNLFAYTGGSTLSAAAAGAKVVHVDAAKNVVAWAKQNAATSGLADAPIRWITDDAMKFVQREIKRNAKYDLIILDPPSYGHGPKGETWRLAQDLPVLLQGCFKLLRPASGATPESGFLLFTCHSPQHDSQKLSELVRNADVVHNAKNNIKAFPLDISSQNSGKLPAGYVCLYGSWNI